MQRSVTSSACLRPSTAQNLVVAGNVDKILKWLLSLFHLLLILQVPPDVTCSAETWACLSVAVLGKDNFQGMILAHFFCRCWAAKTSSCLQGPSTPFINYQCGDGWKPKGDQCFSLFGDKLNYLEANNACIQLGGSG